MNEPALSAWQLFELLVVPGVGRFARNTPSR